MNEMNSFSSKIIFIQRFTKEIEQEVDLLLISFILLISISIPAIHSLYFLKRPQHLFFTLSECFHLRIFSKRVYFRYYFRILEEQTICMPLHQPSTTNSTTRIAIDITLLFAEVAPYPNNNFQHIPTNSLKDQTKYLQIKNKFLTFGTKLIRRIHNGI